MARPRAAREPRTPIYWDEKDERYHAWVYCGLAEDGSTVRRHRGRKQYEDLVEVVLELEDKVAEGLPTHLTGAKRKKFGKFLNWWIEQEAPLTAGYNTIRGTYKFSLNYLVPRLGGWDINALTPAHYHVLYRELQLEGLSAKSISLIRYTAQAAHKAAILHGVGTRNPAKESTKLTVAANSPEAFTDEELFRFFSEIAKPKYDRTRLRWYMRFLGIRASEACAVIRKNFDRRTGVGTVRGQVQRRTYKHGCVDASSCARRNCITGVCPGRVWQHGCAAPKECNRSLCAWPADDRPVVRSPKRCAKRCVGHARSCPRRVKGPCRRHKEECPLCPPNCTGHAKACPERKGGLMIVEDIPAQPTEEAKDGSRGGRRRGRRRDRDRQIKTKSEAGWRRFAIPEFMLDEVDKLDAIRMDDQFAAGNKWEDQGLMFCTPFGGLIDPRRDWDEWGAILDAADISYREPHVTRRTGASSLVEEDVDRRVTMAFFGWSSEAMVPRYQDVTDAQLKRAAETMGSRYHGAVHSEVTDH